MHIRRVIDIGTGEFRLSREDVVLRSLALGSCIALIAYDSSTGIGAVAHIMMPGRSPRLDGDKGRYAENAVELLLTGMARAGSELARVEGCLIGAANVLKRSDDTICRDNIQSLRLLLNQQRIPIRATELGGMERRNALLYVAEGRVSYTQANEPERLLWQFSRANIADSQCSDRILPEHPKPPTPR